MPRQRPRPSEEREAARRALVERLKKARAERDKALEAAQKAIEEAEQKFWRAVGSEVKSYHGAQGDTAEFLDYTRDHVLKQVKKHQGGTA
ncbi:hypothetical protein ACH4PU_35915 [Streptomyces sp. NPDC021100]|uniref:hypothetical protein n=1 Tax=Streptomyces sp. NPDC021100 TaxID=3365114 RepID=UPI00379781CA